MMALRDVMDVPDRFGHGVAPEELSVNLATIDTALSSRCEFGGMTE